MSGQLRRRMWGVLFLVQMGALISGCAHTLAQARMTDASRTIASFQIGLALYHLDTGRYPSEQEGLQALLHPANAAPYITAIPLDPWGRSYRYRLVDDFPVVDSAGPDGAFDTADDIRE